MCIHDSSRTLAHQKFFLVFDDESDEASCRSRVAFAEIWQFFRAVFLECDAKFLHRAKQALRIARRANECTQFHQRLVEVRAGK